MPIADDLLHPLQVGEGAIAAGIRSRRAKLYRRLARVARPVTQAEGLIERAGLLLKLFVFSETNTIVKQHDRQSIIGDVLLRLELLAIFHRLLKEWEGFRRLSILQKESPYTPMGLYAEIHRAKSKRLDRCTNLVLAFAILGSRFSASWTLERPYTTFHTS